MVGHLDFSFHIYFDFDLRLHSNSQNIFKGPVGFEDF